MKNQPYTSFEEVDRDLRILQLRRQIAQEEIKGNLGDFRKRFEPSSIFTGLGEGVVKRFMISWILGFLLRKFRR
ncbi:MAG: DUF6327 family protein [Robiginitalea sp.]|jgi:hypothetical protein